MALSTAAVLGALARKAGDSDTLRQVIDLASRTPTNAVASAVSGGQLTSPSSPLISAGQRFVSSLFGGSLDGVLDLIGRESGLRSGAAWTVLALGAQSVLSFIGTRVRDEGMTAGSLAHLLQSETPELRNALPADFDEALAAGVRAGGPTFSRAIEDSPVVAQSVRRERSVLTWLLPLAVIILGALWFALRPGRMTVAEGPRAPAIGTSGTSISAPSLGNIVPRTLVDGTTLNIPERGVEGRLVVFIQDASRAPDTTTWFDFDRLLFDTGSATLQPQSQEQLQNIAAILKAYPDVHLKIGGYTDNVGSSDQNLKLSDDRARSVMNELVSLGVDPNRLVAKGYGEEHPVADNSTEEGRALNRRISMLVTQK
jgi:OmpA-OmpF porin, OOP family